MELATLLWLGLLIGLGGLFVVTVRRMSALIARTRGLERFQRGVDSLDRRFATSIVPLLRGLDETRRHAGDPVTLRKQVTEAQVVLAELHAECGALVVPPGLAPEASMLTGELERATRAASLVEHGLDTISNPTRGRDLEAQTSLKRGVLNLRHAQEAYARVAREVAALRPPDLVGRENARRTGTAPIATYPGEDGDDA